MYLLPREGINYSIDPVLFNFFLENKYYFCNYNCAPINVT